MGAAAAKNFEERREARLGEAFGTNAEATEPKPLWQTTADTDPRPRDRGLVGARTSDELQSERRKIAFPSSRASICLRRDRPIGKKIIGRTISVFPDSFCRNGGFVNLLRAFPLLHEPAREHGRGILLQPQVEQRADLLAEICGMAETREFIALQRVSRSREEKLPRRLSPVVVHAGLLEDGGGTLTVRKNESRVLEGNTLWKNVEKLGGGH